ncbi:MAG: cytochrome P450 [Thermoplasmataceae archaeon]|jgi:cytochrome P450
MENLWDRLDPYPFYRNMRADKPVYFDDTYRIYGVYRYQDVKKVLGDYNLFSSQFGKAFNPEGGPFSESLINQDPPAHTKLRSIVMKAFTPRAVERMESSIQDICNELVEGMKKGETDFVKSFTYPLPVTVIAEMIGIPISDMDKFKRWSDTVVGGSPESYADFPTAMKEMSDYFMNMIKLRKQDPKDDLISAVIAAEVDGEKLSMIQTLGFLILLLIAGNETTTNLISNAIYVFDQHPGTYETLRNDRSLVPQAIEEVLRYRSPVQSIFRVAKQDVDIAGVTVPSGAVLQPWIGSANHDERVFNNSEKFDIYRKDNRHIAFGEGIHYCLGAPLARLEAKVAMNTLLDNFKTIVVDRKKPIVPQDSDIVFGFKELHVKAE